MLVVDDDDMIREVARVALEVVGGWQVRTASGGLEGYELAVAEPPDLVLLDVMMPGLDGPGTAALLASNPITWHLPVIFVTAKTTLRADQLARAPKLAGVITKPFDPMSLAQQVARLVGWS